MNPICRQDQDLNDSGPARIPGPNMPNRKTDPPILYLLLNDILGVLSDQFTSFPMFHKQTDLRDYMTFEDMMDIKA